MKGLDVKNIRKNLGLSQTKFGLSLGVSLRTVQNWESSDNDLSPKVQILIKQKYANTQNIHITEKQIFKPEGKIIKDEELPSKKVTVIPIKGRGGLENAYYDRLYIDGLKKETLTIKTPSSNGSEWFKIEVEGVSMDDSTQDYEGSKHSLAEGDWAYVRSIPKMYWKDKLHFNKVKVFCFFHNTRGIIFKKVIDHNKETGEVVLHSLNKDKKQFPDFKINIAECSYICNVIKVLSEF